MKPFFNTRIESAFNETYKGYNQYLFTGGVDDLFLIDSSETGGGGCLCDLSGALFEYGKKAKYDIVLKVDENQKLSFATPQQKERFESLTTQTSKSLVPPGRTSTTFRPRQERSPSNDSVRASPELQRPRLGGDGAQAEQHARENAVSNELGKVTRLLKMGDVKSLVIFMYPERMFLTGQADEAALKKMEIISRDWRNIIREAHRATRTVLVVNPHRWEEFKTAEQRVSCYDHNCQEIRIGPPSIEEMRAWLAMYKDENNIRGSAREMERVVLAGKANAKGNLQNFVSWVQGYFQGHDRSARTWQKLLAEENQGAAETKEDLLEQLDRMIGLKEVKDYIHRIADNVEKDFHDAASKSYHMFFLGNPGTGKTETARLVARLFWAMELRPSKKIVELNIHDIISESNVGDTIQKMREKINEAMGGVLFIDEAYLFAENVWCQQALQALMVEMENKRTLFTVIFAGYEERLPELYDVNPGFKKRVDHFIKFGDYSKEEKLAIFKKMLEDDNEKGVQKVKLSESAEEQLLRVLDGVEANGRGVREVYGKTMANLKAESSVVVEVRHVYDPHAVHSELVEAVLTEIDTKFIGMQGLKRRLRDFFENVRFVVERERVLGITKRSSDPYRMCFVGAPGTGKTEVARLMGKFFYGMGITESDECREYGAASLKGSHIGEAQQMVNQIFHENRGKVIFLDEIYSLFNQKKKQDDGFSREAIDTLVRCLTAPEYQNTVVIVAGYPQEVQEFKTANRGLESRFTEEIVFDDYSPEDCADIFVFLAKQKWYEVDSSCREKLVQLFARLRQGSRENAFGNAREVAKQVKIMIERMGRRLVAMQNATEADYTHVLPEDIPVPPEEEKNKE